MHSVSKAAKVTAAIRAAQGRRADALFLDPLAALCAGDEGPVLLDRLNEIAPRGLLERYIARRTAWVDRNLVEALDGGSIDQMVSLAAGFDSRAFRLDLPSNVTVFELDFPDILAMKTTVIDQVEIAPRATRVAVPVDFGAAWHESLIASGFQPDRPAVFVVEGLMTYLTDELVSHLLEELSRLAAPGGVLLTDFIGRALLDHMFDSTEIGVSPGQRSYASFFAELGEPWLFAADEPARLLIDHGWSAQIVPYDRSDPALPVVARMPAAPQPAPLAYLTRSTRHESEAAGSVDNGDQRSPFAPRFEAPTSATQLWARARAAARAIETEGDDPLFVDPLARGFAGEDGFELLSQVSSALPLGILQVVMAVRTKWCDDQILQIMRAADHPTQLVIIAPGFDTRAVRLQLPADVLVFEIDNAGISAAKTAQIRALQLQPRLTQVAVGIDFSVDWTTRLAFSGFDPELPSVWVAENVLVYLTTAGVHRLLDDIDGLSAPGSFLLAEIPGSGTLSAPLVSEFAEEMAALGLPLRFATDSPEDLLVEHGWHPSLLRYGDEGAHFDRWPFPAASSDRTETVPGPQPDTASLLGSLATGAR